MRAAFIFQTIRISSGLAGFVLLAAAATALAQPTIPLPPLPSGVGPLPNMVDRYPGRPSLAPAITIPAGPLGFSVPGENYLLRRQSLVSLDFLDEDRILFTFRVSGLLERDAGDNSDDKRQQIQALLLSLPSGNVEARATWTVPDRSRYLWMLNDGHFLLRVPDGLDEGDAKLQMKTYLRLPGRLLWIEMDPRQQVMITNSVEPATAVDKVGQPGPPVADQAAATTDGQKLGQQSVLVIRTQKMATGEVTHESREPWADQTSDWPMNSEGYLEKFQYGGIHWLLNFHDFSGATRFLTRLDSTCPLTYNFVSDSELLLATCDPDNGWKLRAMLSYGLSLWEKRIGSNAMFPLLVTASNSSRVARETLLLKRSADKYKRMIGGGDLEGQVVKVFDAANGNVVLEAPLTPILDGGGNVAISPSGQRVAILNAGAIQVFQLPAAPPVPGSH
jgi:hypothetical protein